LQSGTTYTSQVSVPAEVARLYTLIQPLILVTSVFAESQR